MAELADATDSKSVDLRVMGVRPPLPAPSVRRILLKRSRTFLKLFAVYNLGHMSIASATSKLYNYETLYLGQHGQSADGPSITIVNGVCQFTVTENTLSSLCSKRRRPGSAGRSCSTSGKGIAAPSANSILRKLRGIPRTASRSE